VTIDLAGFTIGGPGGTAGLEQTAIAAGAHTSGIAVRNGSISGFGVGVNLFEANDSIVEGLRVFGGPGTSSLGIGATGIVKGNTVLGIVSLKGGVGISATGIVTGNSSSFNQVDGIEIGQGSTVIGNTATDNGPLGHGILVECPSNVTDNTAVNNRLANLVLGGNGCNNTNNVAP